MLLFDVNNNLMPDTNHPVFSIITPTCRRPSLLKRAINSVKNQTYSDYEHIIIDDANDPETKTTINELHDGKIIFHQHLIPRGAAGAYNSGIKLSSGKFILFLDDDDEYLPTFLEKMFFHFSRCDSKVGFIWTGILMVRDNDSGEEKMYTKIWPSRFTVKEKGLVEATTIGNGYGLCVRRECVESIGLYDESFTMGHDADYLIRLARKYDFETIPSALVKIHQHGSFQLTSEKNNLLRLDIREKILEKHLDFLDLYPRLFNAHYKHVADLSYRLQMKTRGRQTMLNLIKHSPFQIRNLIDLIFYEVFGKDASAIYHSGKLEKLGRFLKVRSKYLHV